ncbi:TPA: tRNA 2-thiouridine(34) synthase MnmA [Candidatus Dependentiae bacterium]|nr:MAG: tRNA-specific 2-thiouridylase MnmA [candidate division TM6 bacterium GW2011_GWF2_43_87]HBL98636.1 tRNA 2-thiouridine(34) synthase MnmA [Candidatus Dependentiae bacterium]
MTCATLLSGGVDSSVALARLVEQGVPVTAFYLKIWLEDELSFLGTCPWEEDLFYARAVCQKLGVDLEVVPMQRFYHERVVSYTVAEALKGRTPNPDILCNQQVKLGAFLDYIGDRFEKVATGHYAVGREINGRHRLFCSPDPVKDQTYFLAFLSQAQLGRALFPIGHLTKSELRQEAERLDLPTKHRPDSQGICFLGKLKFPEFLRAHLGERKGDLVEIETGKKMGIHNGFWFYTVGQRQGIGLSGGPWYVVKKDTDQNIVYISRQYFDETKKRDECIITDCNWIAGIIPLDREVEVKLRHGPVRHRAVLEEIDSLDGRFKVRLLGSRDQGIALGQFVVVYDHDECLGGGVIDGV